MHGSQAGNVDETAPLDNEILAANPLRGFL
jgi:hypothetical protein